MPFLLSYQNVFDYLIPLGICSEEERSSSNIELKPAKNFNLLLSLSEGRQLLVKQERHNREGKTAGEFVQEWRIHEFLNQNLELSYVRPLLSEAVHFDAENSIIIFNYLSNYRDLADFYTKENIFPTKIAAKVGTILGLIHRGSIQHPEYRQFFDSSQDTASQDAAKVNHRIDRLTPEIFGSVPSDGLKFFALYQRYDSLGQAIAQLGSSVTPYCLTHNDMKLNNILISLNWEDVNESLAQQSMIRLIDWERCSWGDPAHDLGCIIASYLQLWLYSVVVGKGMEIEESLRLATTPLQSLRPSLAALVKAYLAEFPEILEHCPDFLERVVQFCGLALIQSIQATLQHEKTFGNQGISMLQVAKSLLCRPQPSIPTIFGMDASDLTPAKYSAAS
ncbi:aminoglycoside phosphotransferase family protein [Anabaenopsis sp. FSS-46]|uniref:Phosphotransferase n=1 Tax=Anabaenopsis arnoldii TaxID=2152938 RepID=A0ABT5APM8_9CYAN|nr:MULTISPECIES: phosphotransferase [Anabaenopsis]MDB9539279.1 phosphotransferase [Anabaenopsis arnoldii]MDH6091572.1 aminoglycoside phosphotransferase family protein [Anabaenopsis arnoldii]MDH6099511.1 aminoglycoside phosphotransferase family protein [Anabaenopsis sp. FSS-46]